MGSGSTAGVDIDPPDDVGRMVGFGLRWSLVNLAGARALTFLSGIVMARLLVPHDFGVFAVALVVAQALLEIDNAGLTQALIRWQGPVQRLLPTAMTLSLVTSAALYAAVFAAAPWLADMLRAPQAVGPIRVLASLALIDGVAAVPAAVLTRSFRQDHRAVADLSGLVANIVVGVGLALAGAGAWSFVLARLAGNGLACIVVVRFAKVSVRPGYDREDARELLRFGLPLASSGFVNFTLLNVDYVLIGRLLGPVALGYYVLAFNLASTPVNIITAAVRRVSVAGFAQFVPQPERFRAAFLSALRLMLLGTVLLGAGLSVLAEPLIRVVYGSQWSQSAQVLACLAAMGAARVVINLVEDMTVALGRSHWVLTMQATWLVLLAPAVYVAASRGGIREVGVSEAAVAGAVMVLALVLAWRLLTIPAAELPRIARRPMLGAVAAAAAAELVLSTRPGDVLAIVCGGAALVLVYGAVALPRDDLRTVWRKGTRLRRGSRSGGRLRGEAA